ncbi:MAG: glycosyltransferase [Desulfovibrionaceae bacterium]|nr:glycosyltransferase [Desulfovibrionaceae bacterium]
MTTAYAAEPVIADGRLADVRIRIRGKTWHLWGRSGLARETELAAGVPDGELPVLVGSGLGRCLETLLERGLPVAVIDREAPILALTGADGLAAGQKNALLIDDPDPAAAFKRIADWQQTNSGKPLHPVVIPLYPRLDRNFYGALAEALKTAGQTDFWSMARYPKFRSTDPKILFFDSSYFLCREILAALDRAGTQYRTIPLDGREIGSNDFIEALLKAVVDFRPDFALTVNHFGLDREGKLAGLLDELSLPLASWFVDNPHLILFDYAHPGTGNTVLFTFDADNVAPLREKGFPHVHHLPLATDPERFRPGLPGGDPAWACPVSFVGNSMTGPVARSLGQSGLPDRLRREYPAVARAFGDSGETRVDRFLARSRRDWNRAVADLPDRESRLACEALLTWEATRQYRLACVRETLPYSPLIVGDAGWADILPGDGSWRHLPPLDYYEDLPRFYPLTGINFNCTSRQMPGAVNQRVFDVPACGGFLVTDYRVQMEDLFDLDSEAVAYRETGEIPHLLERFINAPAERDAIARKARKRILAEHTYAARLARLVETMRATFA